MFAVTQSKLGDNDIFDKDGKIASGVLYVNATDYGFSSLELRIVGFTDTTMATKLAMGACAKVSDTEGTEYSYFQGVRPSENEKYHFISYSDMIGNLD